MRLYLLALVPLVVTSAATSQLPRMVDLHNVHTEFGLLTFRIYVDGSNVLHLTFLN